MLSRWGLDPWGAFRVLVAGIVVGSVAYVGFVLGGWLWLVLMYWLLGGTTD